MKEKKIVKSITLYESQILTIQCVADEFHEGDFGRAIRNIIDIWMDKK